ALRAPLSTAIAARLGVICRAASRQNQTNFDSRACDPFRDSRPSTALRRRPMNATASASTAPPDHARAGGIDFITMTFLILTPIIAVAGTAAYTVLHGFHLWMPLLFVAMYAAVGLSICAGYHRFFSHKSY